MGQHFRSNNEKYALNNLNTSLFYSHFYDKHSTGRGGGASPKIRAQRTILEVIHEIAKLHTPTPLYQNETSTVRGPKN